MSCITRPSCKVTAGVGSTGLRGWQYWIRCDFCATPLNPSATYLSRFGHLPQPNGHLPRPFWPPTSQKWVCATPLSSFGHLPQPFGHLPRPLWPPTSAALATYLSRFGHYPRWWLRRYPWWCSGCIVP